MANPLHDNPKSKSEHKGYLGGDDEPGETTRKRDEKAATEKKAAESAKEGGGDEKAAEPEKKDPLSPFKTMIARHEGERRDTHNTHRETMRQMHKRHEKELADHFGAMDDAGNQPEPAAAAAPAAEPAMEP